MTNQTGQKNNKVLKGKVVSVKMDKTAVVSVEDFRQHPKYRKFITRTKRYKAHDPENRCQEGDVVFIEESRPISKDKHFKVIYNKV